ncbi:MAG: outer membrane protein transport protein [Labilithrix sp.]|nr:outer membrane protein transport protein [Labilithrix sp.]MBX3223582.1 outer membrane protein transport protein [Labilithrix sp.]
MPSKRRLYATAIALASLVVCSRAEAGGFDELPDQGAEALGRGATFTAKADDATAIYWNVAGLARQRGTKLQVSANVHFNTFYFARTGRYPDDPSDPATPWGGRPFPVVEDKNASFVLPMLAATTDLGLSDRLTFGAGVFGPAATGRTFPLGVKGMPAPSRYDSIQSRSKVLFPTLGAAYRVTPQIDVGVSGHLVVGAFDQLSVAVADPGGGACNNAEYRPCDAEARVQADGKSFAGSIGVLARPAPSVQIGAQLRSPTSLTAEGRVTPRLAAGALPPSAATLTLDLPWTLRLGARYIGMEGTFEQYDLELDGTYEAWSSAQAAGPTVVTTSITGGGKPTTVTSLHRWNDTVSVRAGGAYNVALGEGSVVTLRAGAFYDSPTTDSAFTRLDANTLAKVAGTAGLGVRHGAFTINLAYAAVASISRVVTDGAYRPSNGAKEGRTVGGDDQPLPAVNNGEYRAFTHTVAVGVEVRFDAFFEPRTPEYGDPAYERVRAPAAPAPDDPSDARAPAHLELTGRGPTSWPPSSSVRARTGAL